MPTYLRRSRRLLLSNGLRTYHLLIGAWVLSMIAVPIAGWIGGDAAVRSAVIVSVTLHMSAVLTALSDAWGPKRAFYTATTIVLLAWAIEYVGSTTGFPFGRYHYTDLLQPQLAHVPLVIPMAWLMMLPPAWAIATALCGEKIGLRFISVSALAFTAWDLFLDPQMVAWHYWEWDQPGAYFGIPWQNFIGWFLSAALLTIVIRPRKLPLWPLISIYAITWILQTVGQAAFWGMPGPALAGFLGMGIFLVLVWQRQVRDGPAGTLSLSVHG